MDYVAEELPRMVKRRVSSLPLYSFDIVCNGHNRHIFFPSTLISLGARKAAKKNFPFIILSLVCEHLQLITII